MSIKSNLDYIKNEFSSDEKILQNAFKAEILYKRYKRIIWGGAAIIVVIVALYCAHFYYTEFNAKKYSAVYNSLLENPDDSALEEQLKNGNKKLYDLFILQKALKDGNVAALESLSGDKNTLVGYVAGYHVGSFERDIEGLEKIDKYILGDLAKLQRAYALIDDDKFNEAKLVLSEVSQDSELKEFAKFLSHYLVNKE